MRLHSKPVAIFILCVIALSVAIQDDESADGQCSNGVCAYNAAAYQPVVPQRQPVVQYRAPSMTRVMYSPPVQQPLYVPASSFPASSPGLEVGAYSGSGSASGSVVVTATARRIPRFPVARFAARTVMSVPRFVGQRIRARRANRSARSCGGF